MQCEGVKESRTPCCTHSMVRKRKCPWHCPLYCRSLLQHAWGGMLSCRTRPLTLRSGALFFDLARRVLH